MYSRIFFAGLALLCYISGTGQQLYTNSFESNGMTIDFTARDSAGRNGLQINAGHYVNMRRRDTDVLTFFTVHIQKKLDAVFGTFYAEHPEISQQTNLFSQGFANAVQAEILRLSPKPPVVVETVREQKIGGWIIREGQIDGKDFFYTISPNGAGIETAPLVLMKKTAKAYKFLQPLADGEDFFKDSIKSILAFIGGNSDVKIPKLTTDSIDGNFYYHLEYPDSSTEHIGVTLDQLKRIAPSATLAVTLVKKVDSTAPQETVILPAKTINCNDTSPVEISFFSVPSSKDSLKARLETLQGPMEQNFSTGVTNTELKRWVLHAVNDQTLHCDSITLLNSVNGAYGALKDALTAKKNEEEKAVEKQKSDEAVKAATEKLGSTIANLGAEKDLAALPELQHDSVIVTLGKTVCGKTQQQGFRLASKEKFLVFDSVVMRVEHNLVYQLDVVGKIDGKSIQTISNPSYGLPLRVLIDRKNHITFTYNGQKYYLCYSDLFFIRPTDEDAIQYNIRDGVYVFYPGKKKKNPPLEQKRFLDFLSASVFLDMQAFNANNPNKNIASELYFNFDINSNLKWRKLQPLRYTYTTITLAADVFKESNVMETARKALLIHYDSTRIDTATSAPFFTYHDSVRVNNFYLKNFDLVKYSFFQLRPVINILSLDFKQLSSFIELNLGALFMASNAKIIDPSKGNDSISSVPVFSYSGLTEFRWRISPRARYGIDFKLAYMPGLKLLSDRFQSITGPYNVEDLVKANMLENKSRQYYQAEINFYFNPKKQVSDTDRGALYFKINWLKSFVHTDGHAQFLVGYSSDVKNFFK